MLKIVTLIAAILLTACSTKTLSPANVSDYFWSAQKERNYSDVKKFVKQKDKNDVKLQQSIKIKRFSVGKAEIFESGKVARVPTKIFLVGFFKNDPSDEVEIDFDTILANESDGWKVNMRETRKILYTEVAKKFGSSLSRGMFEKLKGAIGDLEEFKGTFKEILKNMAESVKGLKK